MLFFFSGSHSFLADVCRFLCTLGLTCPLSRIQTHKREAQPFLFQVTVLSFQILATAYAYFSFSSSPFDPLAKVLLSSLPPLSCLPNSIADPASILRLQLKKKSKLSGFSSTNLLQVPVEFNRFPVLLLNQILIKMSINLMSAF